MVLGEIATPAGAAGSGVGAASVTDRTEGAVDAACSGGA
jgi:hypothetical protein